MTCWKYCVFKYKYPKNKLLNQEMLQMFVPGTAAVGELKPSSGLLSLLRHFGRPADHQVLQSSAQVHLPALPENRREHISLPHLTKRIQVGRRFETENWL